MANIRFRSIEGYETFKTKCNFFRCEEEYPGCLAAEHTFINTYGLGTTVTLILTMLLPQVRQSSIQSGSIMYTILSMMNCEKERVWYLVD